MKKVLLINYKYYLYPKDYQDLDSFVEYINKSTNRFILLENIFNDYFCEDIYYKTQKEYVNLNLVRSIKEASIKFLKDSITHS